MPVYRRWLLISLKVRGNYKMINSRCFSLQQGIEALKQHTAAIQQLSTEAAKLSAAFGKFSDGVL